MLLSCRIEGCCSETLFFMRPKIRTAKALRTNTTTKEEHGEKKQTHLTTTLILQIVCKIWETNFENLIFIHFLIAEVPRQKQTSGTNLKS